MTGAAPAAFGAGLDHPDAVGHLGVLDVIPSVDMWDALAGTDGIFAFHIFLRPTHRTCPRG
jgi:haloacetate dehalogenase